MDVGTADGRFRHLHLSLVSAIRPVHTPSFTTSLPKTWGFYALWPWKLELLSRTESNSLPKAMRLGASILFLLLLFYCTEFLPPFHNRTSGASKIYSNILGLNFAILLLRQWQSSLPAFNPWRLQRTCWRMFIFCTGRNPIVSSFLLPLQHLHTKDL